ncbi:MAG TPA: NAD-dependent epimerase/dehydratase family protein [Acidimicrobiales bacterium]|nr:NAD-dependent epimerase/dehydratase family protein [Acidimicrobiales bacterium]
MTTQGLVVGLTGATGHIGGLLLRRLLDDPEVGEVRSVARRPLAMPEGYAQVQGQSGPGVRSRLVHTTADLRGPAARDALAGVDLLYHLAAQVWQGDGAAGLEEMYGTNVAGTRNVVSARAGAVVLVSSASVYGAWPDNPLPLEESHEARPNPECPYAWHKLLAERACAREASRWATVRLSAVLGPHADARVTRAVRGFRLAVPSMAGVTQAVQWLDEAEAVDGLMATGTALLAGDAVAGEVVNLATADWLTAGDVASLAKSRVVKLPRSMLLAASELGKRYGLAPFGADRAVLIAGPLALSVTKAARVIGWRPVKTSAQVLAAAIRRDWRVSPRNRQV